MGTQSGESGSAATTVAPASAGADAHTDHESAASASHERRQTHEKEAVERTGTSVARKAGARSLGQPASARVVGAAEQEAKKRRDVLRLMTHPGVGPLTALAYVLIIGTPERFPRGKQIGTYVGMIPCEDSSAGKQRLGHISKQGNSLLRFLLVEAAQAAARIHPDWRRRYIHLAMRRHKSIAKVAMGRRMAIQLYWMWRNGCEYSQSGKCGSYAGQLGIAYGGK